MQTLNYRFQEPQGAALQAGQVSPEPHSPSTQGLGPQKILNLQEGSVVFRVGEIPQGLYFLKSGAIKLVTERKLNRGRVSSPEFINKIVAPGEFFGFKAAVLEMNYPFYAEVLTSAEVWVYSLESIKEIMNGPDSLMKAVLQQIAADLEAHEQTAQLHYLASVQERIAYQLALLAEKFGERVEGGLSLNLHLTRNELAQLAGTINESLSRHLTELKNEGLIDLRGKEIIVKNLPALKDKSGNFASSH